MTKRFHYGHLMHKAMQSLVAEVLGEVAEHGLPGEHHFFIAFDTRHPGVDMSDALREKYPEEMTIVLQHWFDGLAVMPDRFTVTLNFGDVPEVLVVPFDAMKTFVDPSVEFGLRFDGMEDTYDEGEVAEDDDETDETPPDDEGGDVVSLDKFRKH
ncbi:SspB family protein [Halovulum sp. GXIMD14793]